MEVWDLRNKKGHLLGRTHPRGQALPPGTTHAIIGVWTIDASRTHLLSTKRAPDKHPFPNTWENTGGAVHAGESPVQGAAREVREETGLPCQARDLLPLGRIPTSSAFAYVFLYLYDGPRDLVQTLPGETVAYMWWTLAQLEDTFD